MRRPIVQTRRMCCPGASDRPRALAPNFISAATGHCNVSSLTPIVLDASFVSMVANLRLNTVENSADALVGYQAQTYIDQSCVYSVAIAMKGYDDQCKTPADANKAR